jgi:hypothetical protein
VPPKAVVAMSRTRAAKKAFMMDRLRDSRVSAGGTAMAPRSGAPLERLSRKMRMTRMRWAPVQFPRRLSQRCK